MMQPLPLRQTYNYSNSTWRGEVVSPMAANLQWDIYQNAQRYHFGKNALPMKKKPCLNHHVNMHNIVRTVSIMII